MIVLDIETSGPDPEKHSILNIGAVDFLHSEQIFDEVCKVWDGAHLDPEALAYNGFTEEQVRDESRKSEEQIVKDFFDWVADREERTIMGLHPSFDTGFLQAAAHRYHINYPLAKRSLDLHSIVYVHMVRRGLTPPVDHNHSAIHSDMIMEYVGIPAEPKPHVAINGATWEAEAFSRLINDCFLYTKFEKFPIPWI